MSVTEILQRLLPRRRPKPKLRRIARLSPAFDRIAGWKRDFGIDVHIGGSVTSWTRRYHGFGATMQPFEDNAPRASWEICPARECKQLHEGKIFKCAPLAYLPMQKQ